VVAAVRIPWMSMREPSAKTTELEAEVKNYMIPRFPVM